MRRRNSLQGKAPFCHDCGKAGAHVTGDAKAGYVWLCGSCELKRQGWVEDGSAPGLPINRAVPLQKEKLF